MKIGKKEYEIIDTPGIKNLIPTTENELITIRLILELKPEKVIYVTNEEHMEQNIHLLIQLAELGIPFIINFYRKNDFVPVTTTYDYDRICSIFHTDVAFTTPIIKKGLMTFKRKLGRIYNTRWVGSYSKEVDQVISDIEDQVRGKLNIGHSISIRFIAVMLILKNQVIIEWIRKRVNKETWQTLSNYLTRKTKKEHAFTIAKHWKYLSGSILEEVTIQEQQTKPIYLRVLNKYSLLPLWDIGLIAVIFYFWYKAMIVIGSRFLVDILYNGLFGQYLQPLIYTIFNFFFGESIISDLVVGPYGIFNIGITYALSIILPTVFIFFLIYSLLDEIGYIPRISLSLNKLLRFIGLNGYAFPHIILGNSCKIMSIFKSRTLETKKERLILALLLVFAVPCISQLSVIVNLLSIIPWQYTFIYLSFIILQMLVILKIFSFFTKNLPTSTLAVSITPLKIPNIYNVLKKTNLYARWFIKETLPLIIYSSIFLFIFHTTGLLPKIYTSLTPLVTTFLDLPKQFAETIILGLFRKDIGVVHLYDLANNGFLNSIQVLVSITFLTLSFPCLAFLFALIKERGWRFSIIVFVISTVYAFLLSAALNAILRF